MMSSNGEFGFSQQYNNAKIESDVIRTSKSLNKVGIASSRASIPRNYGRLGAGGITKSQQLSKPPPSRQ